MSRTATIAIALATLAAGLAAASVGAAPPPGDAARAAPEPTVVPDEIVVGLSDGSDRVVSLPPGVRPAEAIASLSADPEVRYANRNWIVTAAVDPLDRGSSGAEGGWRQEQWNFLAGPGGVRAETAWNRVADAGSPGGDGVTVAVVDTGVAYKDSPPQFAISPDFAPGGFAPGRDYVDGNREPLDENGHGTHVAGTIAEQVTLGEPATEDDYLTGLAYNATVMPVRVLDENGEGTSADVARGIRWAAREGADLINLSVQVSDRVRRCGQVRALCRALRVARRSGALVVAASGNRAGGGSARVRFPAAAPGVLAVGASTESGCLAAYSHHGPRLDLLAPGGGGPLKSAARPRCAGDSRRVRQVSFGCPVGACPPFDAFAIRAARGTSMSAAHASGVAALARVSGALGPDPTPGSVRRHLICSARPLGRPRLHGAGLLDAARATRPSPPRRCG